MSEYQPLSTAADLAALDADECLDGYRAGWDDATAPGSDKSKSYWHGWRNAQIDKGRLPPDEASAMFAREVVSEQRRTKMH